MKKSINVKGKKVAIFIKKNNEYISLTDVARYKNPEEPKDVVKNWLRSKNTIEFLGLWEKINNPDFKGVEFDSFIKQAGSNAFVLSPNKWCKKTKAIGLTSASGKGGGTFAHKDIAFEFASWVSPEFKLYLIKEFQRLKFEENKISLSWDIKRELAKINYKIHTDAIKENLMPPRICLKDAKKIYASEADVLNKALFGSTAKEWKEQNKDKKENIRDYADIKQLIVLSNLENLNSEFIKQDIPQEKRLVRLNIIAISQMKTLLDNKNIKRLERIEAKNNL